MHVSFDLQKLKERVQLVHAVVQFMASEGITPCYEPQ